MRIRYAGKLWDVWLEDDGTMDTVISIQPVARPKLDKTYRKLLTAALTSGLLLHAYKGLGNTTCDEPNCGNTLNHPIHDMNGYPWDSQGPYYPSQEIRFDCEFAAEFRRPNGEMTMRGLRILGQEAAESYDALKGFDE